MIIDTPLPTQLPALRGLWKEAFGDTDSFLDAFFHTAFHPDRCRVASKDGHVLAALYWFHCLYENQPIAYLYAVATAKEFRGQGICHKVIKNTHQHLHTLGYKGTLLVPGSDTLFPLYETMGYQISSALRTFTCTAGKETVSLSVVEYHEFSARRRALLPKGSVIQENENLDFLQTQAQFFAGEDFLLTARIEGDMLYGIELLGNCFVAPKLLCTLHCHRGVFRTPGTEHPFAMYHPLTQDVSAPSYFGFAFD